jgi:hypothetical protein
MDQGDVTWGFACLISILSLRVQRLEQQAVQQQEKLEIVRQLTANQAERLNRQNRLLLEQQIHINNLFAAWHNFRCTEAANAVPYLMSLLQLS